MKFSEKIFFLPDPHACASSLYCVEGAKIMFASVLILPSPVHTPHVAHWICSHPFSFY